MNKEINQILELLNNKKLKEAEKELIKLLNTGIDNSELRRLLGVIYALQENHTLAMNEINKALTLNPSNYLAYSNRGNLLVAKNFLEEAVSDYRLAIQINPKYYEAWANMGNVYLTQKKIEEAIECFDNAIYIKKDDVRSLTGKASCLTQLKKYQESIDIFKAAISLCPNCDDIWTNMGWSFYCQGSFTEALKSLNKSLALNNQNDLTWTNKGVLLFDLEQYDEAEQCFLRAKELNNNSRHVIKNISNFYLYRKKFTEGWKEYKKRWLITRPLQTARPEWCGDRSNKRLFVWPEQGIGDQILYASMLSELQSFPQEKIVSVDKKLLPIFTRSFPKFYFIGKDEFLSEEKYEEHLPLGDLGGFFRPDIASFEAVRFPYLMDDVNRTNMIRAQFPNHRNLKCGISWKSLNRDSGDYKSMAISELIPLLQKDGIDFINLQYGDTAQELEELRANNIHLHEVDGIDLFEDVDGVLSIVQACDIIITVSNTTAHLAGALGKKTYLLLTKGRGKFWYWHQSQGANLWYPSIRVIEQDAPGSWNGVIQKLMTEIEK
jgi:tetratricopeptide (TPR) repeat protein